MLGLNLNTNTLVIFIIGYFLYLIITNKFKNLNIKEGFTTTPTNTTRPTTTTTPTTTTRPTTTTTPTNNANIEPIGNDIYDKRYKPVLEQNVRDLYERPFNPSCLPINKNNYKPSELEKQKQNFINNEGINNLLGQNFLNAKHHTQIDKVGNFKGNKKVDIRPEPINPQVGVNPSSQSVINIDWNNNEQVQLYPKKFSDVWQRLI
jgi:hypothetical protein